MTAFFTNSYILKSFTFLFDNLILSILIKIEIKLNFKIKFVK